MYRTQLYIHEEQMQLLKVEAKKTNRSVSDLIRSAIDCFLSGEEKKDWKNDPLINAIGICEADVTDVSTNHDKYLY